MTDYKLTLEADDGVIQEWTFGCADDALSTKLGDEIWRSMHDHEVHMEEQMGEESRDEIAERERHVFDKQQY